MIPVLLYEGVSGHEALGALAALRAAGFDAELVARDAVVVTVEGARLVPSRLGWAAVAGAEAVVVPGGAIEAASGDSDLARALRGRRGRWSLFGGEAVRIAARVGLAEERRVARPPTGGAPEGVGEVARGRLVADGRLLTCTGGDALVDLVLHYVAHAAGPDAARAAAERMGREWAPFAVGATESRA